MTKVIVDTSAWIASFRPEGGNSLKELVKQLISDGKILLPGIIKAEILRGTKTKQEYQMLDELLSSLTYLPIEDDFWDRLARFSFNLLRKGITIPLVTTTLGASLCDGNKPIG